MRLNGDKLFNRPLDGKMRYICELFAENSIPEPLHTRPDTIHSACCTHMLAGRCAVIRADMAISISRRSPHVEEMIRPGESEIVF